MCIRDRGNINAVIDASTNTTVATFDYGPYGELLASSGDVDCCPFRWQSKLWDSACGLYYFGFRHYSPQTGWISRDPIAEAGGLNLYAYCQGDPVNGHDPLGLEDDFWTGFKKIAFDWDEYSKER